MNNMQIALQITALGMGLVFGAIILLWWIMSLLTRITAENETAPVPGESTTVTLPSVVDVDVRARAAAIAVAIALAEQQTAANVLAEPHTTIVSAWQLGMRTRQMYQKGSSLRRRAKQDDR
jgi:Na+-transporting methylmalonyl-CoA/oxaloacetate decarboxylase gamma subunit